MFSGRKLPLTLAFGGLLLLAFGAGCRGFFVKATLTSIAINPTAPQVDVGQNTTLQVFGTYDDGTRSQLTSGIGWSSATPSVATIGATTGVLAGITPGNSTITASAQALSTTASATVLLANVTSITVTPASQNAVIGGSAVQFSFTALAGGTSVPLTSNNGGVLTITPSDTFVTCTASGDQEDCSATTGAGTSYQLIMTYPGTTASATATLTVS
jgi:uncharacterized protein YjdB